jgi:predicted transcriptional regulator
MLDDVHQLLASVGLSEKEARVYLALLSIGSGTIQEISESSGVNRGTTYLAVDALKERGLLSVSPSDKRTSYVAEHPRRIMDLVAADMRTAEERRTRARDVIPELEAMYRSDDVKPVVTYFEGEDGLRTLRFALSGIPSDACDAFMRLDRALAEAARSDESLRFRSFSGKRRFRFLYVSDGSHPVPAFPSDAGESVEVRIASANPFDFHGEIGILDAVVYLVNPEPHLMGCIIHSRNMAKLFRAQFELAWASGSALA